ncbi:unnamed protein product [Symbiodinium natans]|uniref:Uncharacterized protein n=1 Tax=Symbiodinium natans TaxID=878477 RepID=A0A812QDZ3_9DINO|nr:unnamed protein product [Symbiodinium natans]
MSEGAVRDRSCSRQCGARVSLQFGPSRSHLVPTDPAMGMCAFAGQEDGASAPSASSGSGGKAATSKGPRQFQVMRIEENSHKPNEFSRKLLQQIGGVPRLLEMTTCFYTKVMANPHLEPFFASTEVSHHAPRLANWVAEKMGAPEQPWTRERAGRKRNEETLKQQILHPNHKGVLELEDFLVHDRSSAHFAGWHSAKRMGCPMHKVGDHFKLDDSRVWMRLHFWACREVGLFGPSGGERTKLQVDFENFYTRFIGHFVRIYERSAPAFARLECQWSDESTPAGKANLERYCALQRETPDYMEKRLHGMDDVVGLRDPAEARRRVGGIRDDGWPYSDDGLFVPE